jgi:O-antigen ligase
MSIGVGIFLFVVGAVLTFALNVELGWIDLDLVGYLFMGAGIVVVIIGLIMLMRRRTSVVTERSAVDSTSGERVTERATKTDPLA